MDAKAIALIGVWGGLLALERRAFLQAMFSRPLVAAIGTGLLLDDVPSGVGCGLVLELFFLGGASLGGRHPDHELVAAVAASASAAAAARVSGGPSTPAMWAVGLMLALPLARAGRWVEHRLDARAMRYQGRAVAFTDSGSFRRVARQNLRAMWPHFALFGLASAGAAALGRPLQLALAELPTQALRGLAYAYFAMGVAAAAVALQQSRSRFAGRWGALAGTVASALAVWRLLESAP